MAIQVRRGNYNDFDPTRMVAGEFAVCLDNERVYMTISPGNVIQLGTMSAIQTALAQAQEYAEHSEAWAVGTNDGSPIPNTDPAYNNHSKHHSQDSEAWAVGQRDGVDVPDTDPTYHNNAKYWAEQSTSVISVSVVEHTEATSSQLGYQAVVINNVENIINGTAYLEQTKSVPASVDTTFTFTNAIITTDSGIEVWASEYGISPKDVTVSNGQCVVTFNLDDAVNSLTCRIYIR